MAPNKNARVTAAPTTSSGGASGSASVNYASISSQQSRRDDALTDFQNRRIARRLDELERTNPTDIPASSFVPHSHTNAASGAASLLPGIPNMGFGVGLPPGQQQQPKKKQTPNVRKILYAKKTLRDWLEEMPSDPPAPYTLAPSHPPSPATIRKICSSCGYKGAYRCPKCAEWSCDLECLRTHERDGGCGVSLGMGQGRVG